MAEVLIYISLFIIWFALFYHIFLMAGGLLLFINYRKDNRYLLEEPQEWPKVSILIPAYNEEVVIEDTIEAMINLNFPKDRLEIIVIDDNSTDSTGVILENYTRQQENIKVVKTDVHSHLRGKSVALNQGFKNCTGEIIVVYDADNTPEPEAVRNLVLGLIADKNAAAVVGKFRVVNWNKNTLTRFINIETISFQWLAQGGRWFWFKLTTLPGTNFAIRREVLEKLGGWDEKALSEDTELSIRVYNLGYHIIFLPQAVTWEQEPEAWSVWWRQRTRWVRGNLYVIGKYFYRLRTLENKKVVIDLFYYLLTYFLFIGGILTSHCLLLVGLFVDLRLSVGIVSYVLLIVGFLLFVTEVTLAISIEENKVDLRCFLTTILMYFTYSQVWVLLVLSSVFLETKRLILNEETKWYKTKRYRKENSES